MELATRTKQKIRSSHFSTPVNLSQRILSRDSKVNDADCNEQNNQDDRKIKESLFKATFGSVDVARAAEYRGKSGTTVLEKDGENKQSGNHYFRYQDDVF